MKKILSSALALIMLLSCLSVTAFAAENPTTTDKGATITVTGSYDPNAFSQVISVDVAWGAMTFTFSSGTEWNPSTHTSSGASGWTAEGNDITLTNHSNADIVAKLSFYSKISGLGGTFYDAAENGNAITDVTLASAVGTLKEKAPAKTVYFRMEQGEITQDEANLGTVYLTIIDSLTSIDATAMTAEQLQAAVEAALANEPATLHITMPADANFEMLAAINDAIGTEHKVDLILYGMAEKIEISWNDYITVTFICGNHDMCFGTPGDGESHTLTCANCDYSVVESCTLTHTPGENGTHTTTCECGYSLTVDCTLGDISYTWADDNSTCTASVTCTVGQHEIEETVNGAYNAQGVWEADFENALFETQTITHEHNWVDSKCTICGIAPYTYDETTKTYTVYSAEGLYAWLEAAQTDLSTNLVLMADITLPNTDLTTGEEITVKNGVPSGSNWTPISTAFDKAYTGTFEGNDHTITGLRINTETDYAGFIGCLGDGKGAGEIKNLTLADAVLYSTANHIGGFAGYNYSGTISGCTFGSTTDGSRVGSSRLVGGILAYNYSGIVSNCTNNGTVSASGTAAWAGGIVASCSAGSVSGCTNNGTVSSTGIDSSSSIQAGGIVGQTKKTSTISGCINNGDVSATGGAYTDAGGIVGINEDSTVSGCTNKGDASATDGSSQNYMGGIVGENLRGTVDETNENKGEPTTNVGNG